MLVDQAMNQINHTSGAIVVHGIDDALAAAAAARRLATPLTLISAPGAAAYAGPLWFLALVEQARAAAPEVTITGLLDCADHPGHAMAALRAGVEAIVFTGDEAVAGKLSALAAAGEATLLRSRPRCCDPDVGTDKQAAYLDALSTG